jgi:hypothetical protein
MYVLLLLIELMKISIVTVVTIAEGVDLVFLHFFQMNCKVKMDYKL